MNWKMSRSADFIVIGVAAALFSFFGSPSHRALAQGAPASVIGTWNGDSLCVGDRPACKNEDVVYTFESVPGKPEVTTLWADKIIEGKRVPMYTLEFKYDRQSATLSSEFTRRQTHGLWQYTVNGDTMEGSLVLLPDKSIVRRVNVKRVTADQVPAAPNRESYK